MKIRYLEAFGILPAVIDLWEKEYGPELLPIQERAVKECGVLDGKSVVVLGATSSGKTLIAEMASIQHACRREKVVIAVSLKSLAEEKFRQFQRTYGDFGIRVAISHRDRREFDYAIEQGHFDIAIVVYEKLHGLLIRNPDLLRETRLVVIDELQMLGDEERGADLELLLTMMVGAIHELPLQIIGLSAVLGNAEEIAQWLNAQLLTHYTRPVELRKGVLCDGVFQYLEHNTGQVSQEFFMHGDLASGTPPKKVRGLEEFHPMFDQMQNHPYASPKIAGKNWIGRGLTDDPYHARLILDTVKYFTEEKKESVLVFVPTKSLTRQWSETLGEESHLPPAKKTIEALQSLEENAARAILLKTLEHGIGYHNADLPKEIREAMEAGFQSGEIRALFSTNTLGQGLNLAAENTIVVPEIYKYSKKSGALLTCAIPLSQLENQGGRAGRYGYSKDFGRMILVAKTEYERTLFWMKYITNRSPVYQDIRYTTRMELIHPALAEQSWETPVLRLVSAGWCKSAEEVCRFFEKTYSAPMFSSQKVTTGRSVEDRVGMVIESLVKGNFLTQSAEGNLAVTESGRLCAVNGVRVATVRWMEKWVSYFEPGQAEPLELLLMLAFAEDAVRFRIPVREGEVRSNIHRTQLMKRIHDAGLDPLRMIEPLLKYSIPMPKAKTAAIKKTLALHDWITPMETADVERKYNLHAGMIRTMAGDAAWMLRTFIACLSRNQWGADKLDVFERLAERLYYGVNEAGLAFTRVQVAGLGRNHIHGLVHAGFAKPEEMRGVSVMELSKTIPVPIAEKILEQLRETTPVSESSHFNAKDYTKDRIELTGKPVKRRTVLVMNGKELELINSSYGVLLKLARALQNQSAGDPLSGWVHRDDLDLADQWRNISRMRCALYPFLIDPKEPVIDNDGGGYCRLRLHPENLVIDEENHARHWNCEFHPVTEKASEKSLAGSQKG